MINRRNFLTYVPAAAALAAVLGTTASAEAAGKELVGIGAIETLMRGHGLLLRALIIYDLVAERINKGQTVDPDLILKTVGVFHGYLEDFHEHTEEKYVFAPMERAKVCFNSIQELKIQHGTGYELNKRITSLAKAGKLNAELAGYLGAFNRMYRHHAAWEDTVIFPAFDEFEGPKSLLEVNTNVTAAEKSILGNNGFDTFVNQLADVEKKLGIFELSSSTAKF